MTRRPATTRSILAATAAFAALAAGAPMASAVPAPKLTAKIGSTKGTGPGGCVRASKAVTFTLQSDNFYIPAAAKVYLDGKQIAMQTFSYVASTGGAAATPTITRSFSTTVNLSRAKAGRHTLKLVGNFVPAISRRSGPPTASAAATKAAQSSATIRKCAPPRFAG